MTKHAVSGLEKIINEALLILSKEVQIPEEKQQCNKQLQQVTIECEKYMAKIQNLINSLDKYLSAYSHTMNTYQIANPEDSEEKTDYEKRSEEAINCLEKAPEIIGELSGYLTTYRRLIADKIESINSETVIAARTTAAVTIKAEGQPGATQGNAATTGEPQVIYVQPPPHDSLPKMKLIPFAGDCWKWHNFRAVFEELVNSKTTMTPLHKLNYLMTSLQGEALDLANRYEMTQDNYPLILSELEKKYGDSTKIITQLLKKLDATKADGYYSKAQRTLFNEISSLISQLRIRKYTEIDKNPVAWEKILEKFNKGIRLDVLRKQVEAQAVEKTWNIDSFMSALDLAINVDELESSHRQKNEGDNQKPPNRNSSNNGSSQANRYPRSNYDSKQKGDRPNYQSSNNRWSGNQQFKCTFCGNNHSSGRCTAYTTYETRRKRLDELQRCIKCTRMGHTTDKCNILPRSQCRICKGEHHSILCDNIQPMNAQTNRNSKSNDKSKPSSNFNSSNVKMNVVTHAHKMDKGKHKAARGKIVIKNGHIWMMKVKVYNKDKSLSREVYALLDCGSQLSFITRKLAAEMGFKQLARDKLKILKCATRKTDNRNEKVMSITLADKNDEKVDIIAHTLSSITEKTSLPRMSKEDWDYVKKRGILMAVDEDISEVEPEILIGSNYLSKFLTGGPKCVLPSGKELLQTSCGYICIDDMTERYLQMPIHNCVMNLRESELLGGPEDPEPGDQPLTEVANPEDYVGPLKEERRRINDEVQKFFDANIQMVEENGKMAYSTKLPYRIDEDTKIPTNRSIALKRLQSVCKTFNDDEGLREVYNDTMQKQLERGILEIVDETAKPDGKRIHYLAHQPVITPGKSTETRIVMDGSAHFKGELSLNDALHQGPVLMPNLVGTLLRFRLHEKILISDIEKAFLTVRIDKSDRDACRILWLKDHHKPPTPDNILVLRFCAVLFGLICSPYLLAATIRHHLKNYPDMEADLKEELLRNLYVDNASVGAATTEEVLAKYKSLKEAFNAASMNLRDFISNDQQAMAEIPEVDRGNNLSPKFMGIRWHSRVDNLEVPNVEKPDVESKWTKRRVVQYLNSQYDPLGWRVPELLPLKMYYRKICEASLNWDEELPKHYLDELNEIHSKIASHGARINRCISKSEDLKKPHQLIVFTDASNQALGTCVYLRCPELRKAHLLFAKSALADPEMTIPKKELTAIVMGADVAKFLHRELSMTVNITEILLFTDNAACVELLKRPSVAKGTFFRNRLQKMTAIARDFEINDIPFFFGHVSTKENVADITTRPYLENTHWWNGPSFLTGPTDEVKNREIFILGDHEGEEIVQTLTNLCASAEDSRPMDEPQELHRSNSFYRNQRIFCYVLRFIRRISTRLPPKRQQSLKRALPSLTFNLKMTMKGLSLIEITEARREIIRLHQRKFFDKEFMRNNLNLDMFVDQFGVWRCGGRLDNAEFSYSEKHPIVIAPRTRLAKLIVREVHQIYHKSHGHTIQDVRTVYWIPKLRSEVKMVIRRCIQCQKFNNRPFRYPDMPPLPSSRVCASRPFQRIGLDYLGPLRMKNDNKEVSKCYILLITCTTTRCVHLEVVKDLTTGAFINALRRTFARRGTPETIYSDNAPTFTLGESILAEAVDNWKRERETHFHELLMQYNVKWQHAIAYAPWMGGFWERLVASVKQAFQKSFGKQPLSMDAMQTAVGEIEGILNCRPLTYISPETLAQLRPVDFLQASAELTFPIECLEDDTDNYRPAAEQAALQTRKQAKLALQSSMRIVEKFWNQWKDAYLKDLREKHRKKMIQKAGCATEPRKGQVVLVVDPVAKRNDWSLARIVKLIAGKDGAVRGAQIKTGSGQIAERPINLLVPLELEDDDFVDEDEHQKIKAARGKKANSVDKSEIPYKLRPRKAVNFREEVNEDESAVCLTNLVQRRFEGKRAQPQISAARSPITISSWLASLTIAAFVMPASASENELDGLCSEIPNPIGLDSLMNPSCHPYLAIPLIVFILTILPIVAVMVVALIIKGFLRLLYRCFPKSKYLRRLYEKRLSSAEEEKIELEKVKKTEKAKKSGSKAEKFDAPAEETPPVSPFAQGYIAPPANRQGWVYGIMIIASLIPACSAYDYACQQAFTDTGKILSCKNASNPSSCTYNVTLGIDLSSHKRSTCHVFLHEKKEVGKLKIRWTSLNRVCEEDDKFFTRDMHQTFETFKRCPRMGKCYWDYCLHVTPDTKEDEYIEANDYPGISFCEESCGGAGCGCGYTSSGCLFTRIYGKPTSGHIFRISKCPFWQDKLEVDVELKWRGNKEAYSEKIMLEPGYSVRLPNATIAMAFHNAPYYEQAHAYFFTNLTSNTTFLWPEHYEPVLSCKSEEEAKNLTNCKFKHRCECRPAQIGSNCYCEQFDLEKETRESPERSLPIRTHGLHLSREKDGILVAKLTEGVEIKLDFIAGIDADEVAQQVLPDICEINATIRAKGCYRCSGGAKINLNCSSKDFETTATVRCSDDIHFDVNCSPGGLQQEVAIYSRNASLNHTCTIECGSDAREVLLIGKLRYVIHDAFNVPTRVNGTLIIVNEGFNMPDIDTWIAALLENKLILFICIGIAIITVLFIIYKLRRKLKSLICICIILLLLAPPTISSPIEPSPPGECSEDNSNDEIVQTEREHKHPRIIYRSDSPPVINIDYEKWERMKRERAQKVKDKQYRESHRQLVYHRKNGNREVEVRYNSKSILGCLPSGSGPSQQQYQLLNRDIPRNATRENRQRIQNDNQACNKAATQGAKTRKMNDTSVHPRRAFFRQSQIKRLRSEYDKIEAQLQKIEDRLEDLQNIPARRYTQQQESVRLPCPFCGSAHYADNCGWVRKTEDRLAHLQSTLHCPSCLGYLPNHSKSGECPRATCCDYCVRAGRRARQYAESEYIVERGNRIVHHHSALCPLPEALESNRRELERLTRRLESIQAELDEYDQQRNDHKENSRDSRDQ